MRLIQTTLAGAWLVEIDPITDERGFFARSFCAEVFAANGIEVTVSQQSVSFSKRRGTLRGMHYQCAPREETKFIRVTRGSVYDVLLDLRVDSPSYLSWYSIELSSNNRRSLYIPKGIAHGYQTLEDCSEIFYQMSQPHEPDYSRGVRWNDPAFSIKWPISDPILSRKDASYSNFYPNSE